jgi:hypothetical protein
MNPWPAIAITIANHCSARNIYENTDISIGLAAKIGLNQPSL